SCKSRLLCGEVTMDGCAPEALTASERAAGLILACRARPITDVEVAWLSAATAENLLPATTRAGDRYRQGGCHPRYHATPPVRQRLASGVCRWAVRPAHVSRPPPAAILHGEPTWGGNTRISYSPYSRGRRQ